jgi:hypothetical protein
MGSASTKRVRSRKPAEVEEWCSLLVELRIERVVRAADGRVALLRPTGPILRKVVFHKLEIL